MIILSLLKLKKNVDSGTIYMHSFSISNNPSPQCATKIYVFPDSVFMYIIY